MGSSGEHLKCTCPHCGGGIEFPAEGAGAGIECPHCGESMNLVARREGSREAGWVESGVVAGHPQVSELALAFGGRVTRKRPTLAYRLALWWGVAGMVAALGAYAGLVVFLGWGMVCATQDWLRWARGGGGGGGALAAGGRTALFLAGLGLGTLMLGFLLRPFFMKPPRRGQRLALNPASEPLLFAFLDLVCDAVGAPRPERVDVDCRLNASAGFRRGGRSVATPGGDWVLTIGLPLVLGLDLRQFTGVLAHELGHRNQAWGLRTKYIVWGFHAWLEGVIGDRETSDAVLERWGGVDPAGVQRMVIGVMRAGAELSRVVLKGVIFVGQAASCSLLRQMERDADRVQIELVGSDVFESTFRRLCVLGEVRRELYRELRKQWERGERLPENLPEVLVRAADEAPEDRRERWCARRLAREPEFLAAHPSEASRIEHARDLSALGLFGLEGRAAGLFGNFDALARQVTALHYAEDLRIPMGEPAKGT